MATPMSRASTHSDGGAGRGSMPEISRSVSMVSSSGSPSGRPAWHIASSAAVTGVEGKTGRGRLASVSTDATEAERQLSSLYVTAERAALDRQAEVDEEQLQPQPQHTQIDGEEVQQRRWGGAIVNGAVNAAVFSAAVGLTAYRMWSGWGSAKSGGSAGHDHPPDLPPAYDSVPAYEQLSPATARHHHGCSSPHPSVRSMGSSASTTSPSIRSRHSKPLRKKRAQRPSIAELIAVVGRAPQKPPSSSPLAAMATLPPEEEEDEPQELVRGGGDPEREPPKVVVEPSAEASHGDEPIDEDDEDVEMNERLDEMSRRLQGLVTEGQRALTARPSVSRSPSPDQPFAWTFARPDSSDSLGMEHRLSIAAGSVAMETTLSSELDTGASEAGTTTSVDDSVISDAESPQSLATPSVQSSRRESGMSDASHGTFGAPPHSPSPPPSPRRPLDPNLSAVSPTFMGSSLSSPSTVREATQRPASTRRTGSVSTIPVAIRPRVEALFSKVSSDSSSSLPSASQVIPGAKGPPPRGRKGSSSSQTSVTPSESYRALPPLPWRRDRHASANGEVKWVQRPVSPAKTGSSAGPNDGGSSTVKPTGGGHGTPSPKKRPRISRPLSISTPPPMPPIPPSTTQKAFPQQPRTPTTPSPRTPHTPRTPAADGPTAGTPTLGTPRSRIPRYSGAHSRANSLAAAELAAISGSGSSGGRSVASSPSVDCSMPGGRRRLASVGADSPRDAPLRKYNNRL